MTGKSLSLTQSEVLFEQWCRDHGVVVRRIRPARAQGYKRPDCAIRVLERWCVVEIKQLDQKPEDKAHLQELLAETPSAHWADPGARLRKPIRDAASQLRKFSQRGFPTVVCFFDTTVGFYLEPFHVEQAMFGRQTLRFEVSGDPRHEPRFLGSGFGKSATLTQDNNTSISAIAVLRQPTGLGLVIDLYHNHHARVPIPQEAAEPLVRKQSINGDEHPDKDGAPTIFDLMKSAEWQEWLDDPEGKFDREVEKCLEEFRAGKTV